MRKREIHSVAHWAMMFILLMFPVLMVVVGAFQNAEYQPEQVQLKVSYDDLQVGNTYHMELYSQEQVSGNGFTIYSSYTKVNNTVYDFENTMYFFNSNQSNAMYVYPSTDGGTNYEYYYYSQNIVSIEFVFNGLLYGSKLDNYDYFYKYEYIDNYHYKNDVNLWTKSFLDLPINSWYKSLMNVIGVGFTNSSVMNVIYVMPVYILWVFIFDVIVDCFLVIIKLPHKLLNRLSGGENE